MKKLFVTLFILTTILLISAFTYSANSRGIEAVESGNALEIPANIQSILDNSCWGCHNSESQNSKAKMKLKFDELNDLKVSKQVAKLNKIVKTLNKGDMPPEKAVNKYPDMALTPDAKSELIDWAKSASEELMK